MSGHLPLWLVWAKTHTAMLWAGIIAFWCALIVWAAMKERQKRVNKFGVDRYAGTSDVKRYGLLAMRKPAVDHAGREWRAPFICLGAWKHGDKVEMLRDCSISHDPHQQDNSRHVLISGPSGVGKTFTFFYPTLTVGWMSSMIANDLKGEIADETAGRRAEFSNVVRLELCNPNGAAYNPLFNIRTGIHATGDAQSMALMLGPDKPHPFWDNKGRNYLAAAILWALAFGRPEHKTLGGIYDLLSYGKAFGLAMMENEHPDPEIRNFIRNNARNVWNNPNENIVGGLEGTAQAYLEPFTEGVLRRITARSDFSPSDLMCSEWPMSLYLITSGQPDVIKRCGPFMRLLVSQILSEMMARKHYGRDGRLKNYRLLWALDEFREFGRMGDFAAAMSRMRGYGMRAMIGVQSFGQITEIYEKGATEIFNNCRAVTTRQEWLDECRIVSDLMGDAPEERTSNSVSATAFGTPRGVGHSTSTGWRRLMQPGEVNRLDPDRIIVFGEQKLIKAWRTPPGLWEPLKRPAPEENDPPGRAITEWTGGGFASPMPEDMESRLNAPTKKRQKVAAGKTPGQMSLI